MANEQVRESKIDWLTLGIYFLILLIGWVNLYSSSGDESDTLIDLSTSHGKEAIFILASLLVGGFILFLDTKFLEFTSYIFYGIVIAMLVGVLAVSAVGGATSWFEIGGFKLQPTEFAKVATLMALAKYMSRYNFNLKNRNDLMIAMGILALPILLVLMQNDAGSALVFISLIFVFYREGLHPLVIVGGLVVATVGIFSLLFSTSPLAPLYIGMGVLVVLGISFVYVFRMRFLLLHLIAFVVLLAIPFVATKVIKPYQTARFRVLVENVQSNEEFQEENPDPEAPGYQAKLKAHKELHKVHYNYWHSLVAVGSGGFWGKGFGKSTHTKGDFVPEEQTDYIHCVFAEEHGFVGSFILLILFFILVARIFYISENAKSGYARIFGFGVGIVFMVHVVVNIGMSIGLVPTIGIPLPFLSYGGSSMLSFSTLVFIIVNHYSNRSNILH